MTNPLLGMNKVQKLGAAVAVLVLLFLPYLGFSLTSGKKAPARSSGMAVKQAPAPASGLNLTLIMVGIGVGAVVVAYSGWLWKLKEKQAANTAEQAQQLATYRLTFGKGGQATVKQVIAVLNKLHPIMAQGEQSRLQATAPIPQLVVLAHRNEGKCMYLRLPQGNRALETTVRAVLDSLGVQMTWLGGLPLAVPPLMGSKGKPRRVKFSYQLAKAAKDSPYPIKSDFGDDGNPLVTLAGMLKVSSEMPVAGILFDFRAGGREWLASSAGQVKKLREKQAKVVAGLRSQGSKELIKVLEEKQAKGTKRSFELGRVVLFAAGYKEENLKEQVRAMLGGWLVGSYDAENEFVADGEVTTTNREGFQAMLDKGTEWGLLNSRFHLTAPELAGLTWFPPHGVTPDWMSSGPRHLPPPPRMTDGNDEPMATDAEGKPIAPIHTNTTRRRPVIGKSKWRSRGLKVGYSNLQNGFFVRVKMLLIDLIRHVHVIGMTGSGKTTWMINLLLSCIAEKMSVVYIEPHGDGRKLIERIPDELEDQVVVIDPAAQIGKGRSVTLNIMKVRDDGSNVEQVLSYLMSVFAKLIDYGTAPRSKIVVETSLRILLTTVPNCTIHEFWQFLDDRDYRAELLAKAPADYARFWQARLADLEDKKLEEIFGPAYTRVLSFLTNKMVASILTNPESTINFRLLMDNRKIVVVTLPDVAEDYAMGVLGSMFFGRIRVDGMSRRDQDEEDRVPCAVLIDEFGDFCDLDPTSLAKFFSGIRKFNIAFIVAHQLLKQLGKLVDEVIGNTGTKLAFKTSPKDAPLYADVLGRGLQAEDVAGLPLGNAYIQPMVEESVSPTALIQTFDFPPTKETEYPACTLEDGWLWVREQGYTIGTREAEFQMAEWINVNKGCLPKYERIVMMSDLKYAPPAINRFAAELVAEAEALKSVSPQGAPAYLQHLDNPINHFDTGIELSDEDQNDLQIVQAAMAARFGNMDGVVGSLSYSDEEQQAVGASYVTSDRRRAGGTV